MCTAITFENKSFYFGRNLDLDFTYKESVTITPQNYKFKYKYLPPIKNHYAIIGIATVVDNYPLYYDAANEKGLCIAGLNFVGNAVYKPFIQGKINLCQFEIIPYLLGKYQTVDEVIDEFKKINLTDTPFSENFPVSQLHWLIADKTKAITVEATSSGIEIFQNPFGVLTNNPPFKYHTENIKNYLNLTSLKPENRFSDKLNLIPQSNGLGGFGLPGDLSSSSRFIRAVFTKFNSVKPNDERESINQFFKILESVFQQEGCVKIGDGFEKTQYSSCINTDKGVYYYKTYSNSQITGVNLYNTNFQGEELVSFPLKTNVTVNMIN